MSQFTLRSLVAAACFAIAGCGGAGQADGGAQSALDRISKSGVMRVAYVRFAPCADVDAKTGQLSGIFVDAITEIATAANLKVEFKETTLATFASGLNAGEFDFSIGATFITPPRAVSVLFTKPLLALGNSGVVKVADATRFTSVASLNQKGVRVAVLQGQAMEEFVRSQLPLATLVTVSGSDLTTPLTAVMAGQAEVGLTNSVTVQQFVAANSTAVATVFPSESALARLSLAWVVPNGDYRLKSFLESSIDWLVESGKFDSIQARYPIRLSPVR